MDNITTESQVEKQAGGPGCLGEAGWFLSGAILPMGSLTYYRKAAQRSVASAVLFFFCFTVALATLSTISIGVAMFSLVGGIQQAYANGDVPEIVISHGVAEADGPQPFIFLDDSTPSRQSMFIAVDTSGEINEIDTKRYDQGFLLTRTELHMLNQQGDYQTFPLSDLNTTFEKDPILINADTVSQAWGILSTVIVISMFILLVLWHLIVRLMFIATVALVMWGIVSLIKPSTGFGPVIITGLYAVVPAIYVSHLFSRSGFGFPGVQTLFLLIFWAIGLAAIIMEVKFVTDDQPVRSWTALIGMPMLILYTVDIFRQIPDPYGAISLWAVTILTGLTLVGLPLFLRSRNPMPEQPAA